MRRDKALRLMLYDDTCRGKGVRPGLTHSWIAGGWIYRGLGRLDAVKGVKSWKEGLEWLARVGAGRKIGEVQYWGHGKWGRLMMERESLDLSALERNHGLRPYLEAVRERMAGPEALWWFRTCETFGAYRGHEFARGWTDFFGTRAAGHTYIIGPWQSGLHQLRPGEKPDWSVLEGLREGTPAAPVKALWSKPGEPNTIFCLQNGEMLGRSR